MSTEVEAAAVEAVMVSIDSIRVGEGRRSIDYAKVRDLADSIRRLGLLNPVTILSGRELVAGLHRIEACRLLGWPQIPAVVVDLDAVHAEIAAIDENLARNDLSVLERGQHLLRSQTILSANGDRAKAGDNQHARNGGGDTVSPPHTTADLARQAGVSERTAQRSMSLARRIPSEIQQRIMQTPAANSTKELEALARLEPESQTAVAERLASGDVTTVREGRRRVRFDRLREQAAAFRKENTVGDDQGIITGDMAILWDRLEDNSVPLFLTDPRTRQNQSPSTASWRNWRRRS